MQYTNASVFFLPPLLEEHYMTKIAISTRKITEHKTKTRHPSNLLLACSLLRSLGNLASLLRLVNALDDTNSNRLSHITNSKPSKGGIIRESLDAHGLGRNHLDDSSITRLDEFGRILNLLSGSSVDFLEKFSEFAGNVGRVTIEDGGISSTDLTRMVQHDDLSIEGFAALGWIVLGISANIPSSDFLDRDVLDVEPDVVAWETLDEGFVVHFDGFDFGGDVGGGKSDDHAGFDDTGFDSTDWNCSDTADLVDVLEGQAERFVGGTDGGLNAVDGFK